jgi:predicted dehydrogenase
MPETAERAIPYGYTPTWAQRDKYNVKNVREDASKEVRLALIGLGGVAVGRHLPAVQRLQDTGIAVSVVAGADPDPIVRSNVEHNHGFPCYANAVDLFDKHPVDAALLLTDPGQSRLDTMNEAILRGIHFLSKKPFLYFGPDHLSEAIAKSKDVLARAKARNLVVTTGFVKLFSPPYQVAKQLIDDDAIGAISLIAIKLCQGWSRHILLEGQACHVLHLARWIGGEIKGLQALASNRYGEPNYPHDNFVVNVEFESGAIGAFYFNSSAPALKPWERLEVFGNRKWLAVEDQMTVTLHDSDEGPSKVWSPVLPTTLFFDEEFSGFTHQLWNFVQAIRGDAAPAVTGDDGIAALRIAHMIHIAARERRYVSRDEIE